jgi:hypothetical protein
MFALAKAALAHISLAIHQPNSLEEEIYAPDTPVLLN